MRWWDLDESVPILRVGVRRGANLAQLQDKLDDVGVESGFVAWTEAEATAPLATVRDHNRNQVESGFQITYFSSNNVEKTCTHGASILESGVYGFLTNAHCSTNDAVGVNNGTDVYQHESDHKIGDEAIDPPTWTGGACPATKNCRYSDAMFVDYTDNSLYAGKKIAETSPVGTTSAGGLTVARYRLAPVSANVVAGMVVRKTGRTTGTTEGSVVATCVDVTSSSSGIVFLCQDRAGLHSQGGDSGSPMYWAEDYSDTGAEVYHVGLLWGGDGSTMTFSPWYNITLDLGVFY